MVDVALRRIEPTPIAVARREVRRSEIGAVMVPALDAVWAFVRGRGLETGHNVAVYVPAADADLTAWFGVRSPPRSTATAGSSPRRCPQDSLRSPRTSVPTTGLVETNRTIVEWCRANGHALSGTSWEIYGDWTDDPAKLETTVGYLLA